MRKFKHKEKNLIAELYTDEYFVYDTDCSLPRWVVEDSNDWEEVVKKDYQVIQIKTPSDTIISYNEYGVCTSRDDGAFPSDTRDFDLEKDKNKIYSVKRISDGEVFTVGDYFISHRKRKEKIKKIAICDITPIEGQIKLIFENGNTLLKNAEPLIKLFTTNDGVDIFEGDVIYKLMKGSFCLTSEKYENQENNDYCFYFSTKEAAEEYILMNKPINTSLNEIKNKIPSMQAHNFLKLKKLIKSKL